jgi:hypothetical protein
MISDIKRERLKRLRIRQIKNSGILMNGGMNGD